MKTTRVSVNAVLVSAAVMLWLVVSAACVCADALPAEKVIHAGESEIMKCRDVTRVVIGDPYIADVIALSSGEILLNGKCPGATVLYIWDASGRTTYNITVKPAELDMTVIIEEITQELRDPRICVRAIGGTLVLEGKVSSKTDSDRADAIAQAVLDRGACGAVEAPKTEPTQTPGVTLSGPGLVTPTKQSPASPSTTPRVTRLVNLIKVERDISEVTTQTVETAEAVRQALSNPVLAVRALPDDLVVVEGKVGTEAELKRVEQLLKGWTGDEKGAGKTAGVSAAVAVMNHVQIDSSVARQILVRTQIVDIQKNALKELGVDWGPLVFQSSDVPGQPVTVSIEDQPFLIGQTQFAPFPLFDGGPIQQWTPIGARVKALETKNLAKTLAHPNLLVLDGREASMLVGGEIPIPIVQSAQTGTVATVTIEYKEYGVKLRVTPTITSDDTVQLKIAPEVSSIDRANSVVMSGFVIPALRVRRAESVVNLKNGQSLVLAGLIQNDITKLIKQIPLLGDIPILGEFFKMTTLKTEETDLVIIISPEIVKQNVKPCQ
jgi:pilus assembly protein CpaC